MLVAFSLRRRNLGRRNLRTAPANPNSPDSARLRFCAYIGTVFRSKMRARLSTLHFTLPHRRGCWAITYM